MNVYIYTADLYCEDCGKAIKERLDYRLDDSNDFPKGPYPDGGGESDYPRHCGAGPECRNAIKFPDGHKAGAWLGNELTAEGIDYVREAIQRGGEIAGFWAEFYCDYDL